VLAADGTQVLPGSGQVGTLAFGGPIPEGYDKDAAKTTATFRTLGGGRYTMPGDLATVDADGAIRFLGRGVGVINTGGWNWRGSAASPPGSRRQMRSVPLLVRCCHPGRRSARARSTVRTRVTLPTDPGGPS
jgi:hypothetical protein